MNDFDHDCMVKKRIAGNARRMKNGSKSRRCSLPSDHLTKSQWQKKNGSVKVMNLNQPMAYQDLKEMSVDLQREYINRLIDKFGCTKTCLADFFGVDMKTITKLVQTIGIDPGRFKRGSRMTPEETKAFTDWAYIGATIEEGKEYVKVTRPAEQRETSKEEKRPLEEMPPLFGRAAPMAVTHMELVFCGQADASQIANTIRCISGDKHVRITISIDEVTDDA